MAEFSMDIVTDGGAVTLRLSGTLNTETGQYLWPTVRELILGAAAPERILIDGEKLVGLTRSGIGALIRCHALASLGNINLSFINLQPQYEQEVTRAIKVMDVFRVIKEPSA